MAHQLTHEVIEHAPQDLTQAELNVLNVLAYHAQVEHRRCWMTTEDMQHRTRLTATALRQALQRLAGRGLECRVAQGAGKDGRPVYAYRGRVTVFQLPRFTTPDICSCTSRKGDATQAPTGRNGDVSQPPTGRNGDIRQAPFGQKGDVSQPERRLSDVAQYRRTEEKEGGTTDATTRPRAHATPNPHPVAEHPSEPSRPRTVPDPDPEPLLPDAAPIGSRCGRTDCRSPGPCGACGEVRRAGNAAERLAVTDRAHARQLEAHRRAQESAAALASCPNRCDKGWLRDAAGPYRCNHQVRPVDRPGRDAAFAALAGATHRRRPDPSRGVLHGRHRAPRRELAEALAS